MHFGFRQIAAAIAAAGLIFFCSCEEHRLGEDPEIQKERGDKIKGGDEDAAPPSKTGLPGATAPNRTPAEFFPKNTPSP